MNSDQVVEFGSRMEGRTYQPRPGSYAVIVGQENRLAVMQTAQGYFLPGGGANPGEAPEETLRREILEECGYEVKVIEPLGFAIEYVIAEGEGYFAKQCSLFFAAFGMRIKERTEEDHQLIWLDMSIAMDLLTHKSQAWAVAKLRNASCQ